MIKGNNNQGKGWTKTSRCRSCGGCMGGIPKEGCPNSYHFVYHKHHRRLLKGATLQRKFGMSLADYYCMKANQKGRCAICKVRLKRREILQVDHDHFTGKVRGLLCNSCNAVLGYAHDKIEVLRNAITYLENQ